jgi:addiction module HigA family antidote
MLIRKMRPVHPGEILRDEVIEANELTITEAARLLGVSRLTLSKILNEKSDISPEMAFRIARVFGGSADIWATLQTKYNMQRAAEKAKHLKLIPYRPGKAV